MINRDIKLTDNQELKGVLTFNFHDKNYKTDLFQLIERNVNILERVEKLLKKLEIERSFE